MIKSLANLSSIGKTKRLNRLFDAGSRKCLIVPLDDSLISGPQCGLESISSKLPDIIAGQPNAILGFLGLAKNYRDHLANIPFILNLTASSIRSTPTKKTLVGKVESAIKVGADSVAVHVNVSSKFECDMLKNLGQISEVCDDLGMPLMAIMYPRTENSKGDGDYERLKEDNNEEFTTLVSHSVRIGVELGADIIKTKYTGSVDSFKRVIDSNATVPIVIAGGPLTDTVNTLKIVSGAMEAGAAGVSIGRNVFGTSCSPASFKAIKGIVHEGKCPIDVIKEFNLL